VNFVSLGRIHPDKRQLDAIDIVEGVRHRGHDAGLYLVGDAGGDEYAEKVRLRAKAAGPWVRLCHDISRDELEDLLSANRYGLHTMHNEHFGIAVAEFVRAGCIVFVHDSGGPVEIVGNERSLRYDSPEDAVERICRVLESDAEQDRLRTRLDQQSAVFSEENFTRDIRKIVKSFAASR
jgi:glycosyltransferase involved in cell wall biosynthesis